MSEHDQLGLAIVAVLFLIMLLIYYVSSASALEKQLNEAWKENERLVKSMPPQGDDESEKDLTLDGLYIKREWYRKQHRIACDNVELELQSRFYKKIIDLNKQIEIYEQRN